MENENINDLKKMLSDAFNCTSDIANVSTITGDPIALPNGTTIIPISKLSVGMATGGLDFNGKNKKADKENTQKNKNFGGAGGTGFTVTPVGFLVINSDGKVELLNVNAESAGSNNIVDSVSNLLDKSPEIIEKIKAIFKKDKND